MENQKNNDSLISYLAATAPALFQLIAVVSIGLVDVLKFKSFVLAPQFINIANFITVLLSVAVISLAAFWDYNKINLTKEPASFLDNPKKFWKALKIFCFIAVSGFFVFVGIITYKNQFTTEYLSLMTFIQWIAYISSMVSISFIIYGFVLMKIQEKNNRLFQDNYIPRLLDSLRRYGHIKNPDIVIEYISREKRLAVVKLGGESKFVVESDYSGEMISIQSYKDYIKSSRNNSPNA